MMKISLIQSSCSERPGYNLEKAINSIENAAVAGARIVVLQELFNTMYFCREINPDHFKWAEPIPGPVTDKLCEVAKSHRIVIIAPLFERKAPGLYFNSAAVIDADGTLKGVYRKMHIPDDPGFHEKYYFTPGDRGYQVFQTAYGRIGVLICWDQWYPEAARITSMMGADLLVFPTAIGTIQGEEDPEKKRFMKAWRTIQCSHAIANGCFIASINRTGEEGKISFWGHSFIAGPFGETLAEAGITDEILSAALDLSQIEKQRQIWPFFRDRRIDSYKPLLKRWLS